jgi:hypothetical protein
MGNLFVTNKGIYFYSNRNQKTKLKFLFSTLKEVEEGTQYGMEGIVVKDDKNNEVKILLFHKLT